MSQGKSVSWADCKTRAEKMAGKQTLFACFSVYFRLFPGTKNAACARLLNAGVRSVTKKKFGECPEKKSGKSCVLCRLSQKILQVSYRKLSYLPLFAVGIVDKLFVFLLLRPAPVTPAPLGL